MKIYFLSSEPCALFLNELYYGVVDTFERFIELSLSDKIYARFCPQGKLALGVFLNENLLENPPDRVEIYHLPDGVAIYAKEYPPSDFSLRLIAQKQFEDTLITVFSQGALQLSVQSAMGYFNATLPPSFSNCEVDFHSDLCVLKSENTLGIYTKTAECLLVEKALDYSFDENILTAVLPLSDRLKRTARCVWELSPTSITRKQFTILQNAENTKKEELIAYAFFESLRLGEDGKEFLSEELQKNADKLLAFIGSFQEVIPTDNPLVCGLVKEKRERIFEVIYYTVELENERIIDIFV